MYITFLNYDAAQLIFSQQVQHRIVYIPQAPWQRPGSQLEGDKIATYIYLYTCKTQNGRNLN